MSRHETIHARCDVCRVRYATDAGRVVRFDSHHQATINLIAAGWYVDATGERCPKHWPRHTDDADELAAHAVTSDDE